MCGQRTAIAVCHLSVPPSLRWLNRILGGVACAGTLFRVLQDELQLVEVELFRARAVAMAQQALVSLSRQSDGFWAVFDHGS
jgi:hypothetical protein